ncbi:hypothetical protein [Micromonospora okii]|uniref:hypothetical protein n=1 Tax=Micromonospora okii TaxID=1182970 RepID=UPI001E3EDA02|nr:hypothetical protein [Micromonospora okii]
MLAAPGGAPKIRLNADVFLDLLKPLGFDTTTDIARHLGVDPGNLGRILRGQGVSTEFIARVHLAYPKVPFERLFRVELS